jgi:hypothetical protein
MQPAFKALALRGALIGAALLLPQLHLGEILSWRYATAIAQPAAEKPASSEKEAFESAKELGTVEAWDAFLAIFPTGFHADLARAYVKKLAGPATPPPAAAPSAAVAAAASGPAAQELPCADAGKFKSKQSDKSAKIRFVNESGATLIIQWIDFKGALKEYGELQPGAEMIQETFLTHPWIAAYQEGSCRQLFLPGDGVSIARLLPEDQLRASRKASRAGEPGDVARKKKSETPSKATVERRAKAACVEIGMIYLNGQCAPKKKAERDVAKTNKNKACPAGMYRNPYGQCQPNETGN